MISDRKEHLETLSSLIKSSAASRVIILTGDLGKKERTNIFEEIRGNPGQFCLFATGSLIGEGVDLPELNTLVITMPISFQGRLTQYVGRLHRQNSPSVKEITVYDYVDTCSGIPISMFKKRLGAYKKLGYAMTCTGHDKLLRWL